MSPPLSHAICRMSRAALGWSRERLAKEANLAPETIRRLERGGRLHINHIAAITGALGRGGIKFVNVEGYEYIRVDGDRQ